MKLVLLVGDIAVGKMTVGQELSKITGLRLFHNHITIEPVIELFGTFRLDVTMELREVYLKHLAASDLDGVIFTMVWDFDCKKDYEYVEHLLSFFRPYGAEFYFVELDAPQNVRLERNETENRLKHKPSMRQTELARARLIKCDEEHRCVSRDGEIPYENFLRIDNTNLPAADAAKLIKETFDL